MEIQAGDIFFTKLSDPSYQDWVDQLVLRQIVLYQRQFLELPEPACEIVHAGVVTDWPRGINSRMRGGVQEIDISKEYPAAVVLRHASCIGNPELGRKVADEAVKLLGGKYDNWANLKFAFPVLYIWMRMLCHGVLNVSKLNCIGLAVQCLRSAGLKIGWYLPTEAITPGMGFMDENMYLVTDEGAICRNMNTRAVTPEFVRAVYRKL